MNRFKYNALKDEFPFLAQTAMVTEGGKERDPKNCDGITIKRITQELLDKTPQEHSWDGSLVGINKWVRVDFILKDGSIIKGAVMPKGSSGSNYAYEETHSWQGETVLEAIYRHCAIMKFGTVPGEVEFIVWTKGGYNVVEHYSQRDWRSTIYKPAKGQNLIRKSIINARGEALDEVKAEANF